MNTDQISILTEIRLCALYLVHSSKTKIFSLELLFPTPDNVDRIVFIKWRLDDGRLRKKDVHVIR